jgi:hypothetical protein
MPKRSRTPPPAATPRPRMSSTVPSLTEIDTYGVFIKSLFSSDTAFSLPVRHKYRGNIREELTWPEELA